METTIKRKVLLSPLIALGLMAASHSANAQVIGVGATIAGASCTITTGGSIAFGVYNPILATAVLGSGTATLTCTAGSIPIVAVSDGSNFLVNRRMISGASFLSYEILQPVSNAAAAACPAVGVGTAWPAAPGLTLTAAPSTVARVYNICGRLPALQSSPAGTYSDNITVSFTF